MDNKTRNKLKAMGQRVRKFIKRFTRVGIFLFLVYVFSWAAFYVETQKICISYKFESTEVTYDFQPYCVGISQGNMYVVPVQTLIKQGGFNMYPGPNG